MTVAEALAELAQTGFGRSAIARAKARFGDGIANKAGARVIAEALAFQEQSVKKSSTPDAEAQRTEIARWRAYFEAAGRA